MKGKVILTSVVTIALCLCILTGSTFALFTSTDTVNIAVTAGKVIMTAEIDQGSLDYYTVRTINGVNQTTYSSKIAFENGGGVDTIANGTIEIGRMTPGDKLDFTINLTNGSNVDIKYCVVWTFNNNAAGITNDQGYNLHDVLEVFGEQDWVDWGKDEAKSRTTEVIIHLPDEVGNTHQGAGASITFTVYAIQGNASGDDLNLDNFN